MSTSISGVRLARPLMLVVEDDFILRETICTVLAEAGYRTTAAATLRDAVA